MPAAVGSCVVRKVDCYKVFFSDSIPVLLFGREIRNLDNLERCLLHNQGDGFSIARSDLRGPEFSAVFSRPAGFYLRAVWNRAGSRAWSVHLVFQVWGCERPASSGCSWCILQLPSHDFHLKGSGVLPTPEADWQNYATLVKKILQRFEFSWKIRDWFVSSENGHQRCPTQWSLLLRSVWH